MTNRKIPLGWLEPTVHSLYIRLLARVHGIKPATLAKASSHPRLHSFLEINNFLHANDYPRSAGAGVKFGLSIPAVAHGFMGMAAVSAPTLKVCLETITQYTAIRSNFYHCRFSVQDQEARVEFTRRFEFGDYTPLIHTVTLTSFVQLLKFVLPETQHKQLRWLLPWKLKSSTCPLQSEGLSPPQFIAGNSAQLRVPIELLDQPLQSFDPQQHAVSVRLCEEELAALVSATSAKVKYFLEGYQGEGWPKLDEVADHLALSRRTLIRKLAAEGTSYSELSDYLRGNLARWYLRESQLSIAEIASRLGYLDASNFSRTFRQWSGTKPSSYRDGARAPTP